MIAMQFTGKKGEKENASALREMRGMDIQTLPHDEAVAAMRAGMAADEERRRNTDAARERRKAETESST